MQYYTCYAYEFPIKYANCGDLMEMYVQVLEIQQVFDASFMEKKAAY